MSRRRMSRRLALPCLALTRRGGKTQNSALAHTQGERSIFKYLRQAAPAIIFAGTMAVGGAILLNQAVQDGPLNSYTVVITNLSRLMVELTGIEIIQTERALGSPVTGFAMRVDNDCNGMWAHLILLASILAYPATWKEKAGGLAVGQAVLYFINVFRVASLFFIGVYVPSVFRAAHVYVWQFLIIGFALVLLFAWVEKFVDERAT